MKKLFLSLLFFTSVPLFAQIKINSIGDIGIGGDPISNYKLRVYGSTRIEHYNLSGMASLEITTSSNNQYGMHISGPTLTPYKLYVVGNSWATQWLPSSDKRLKKNIEELDNRAIMAKIMNLEGKNYEFKNQEELQEVYTNFDEGKSYKSEIPQFQEGVQFGLIAQELEELFPELVQTSEYVYGKAINYNGMVPILIEAVQYLNVEKEKLKKDIIQSGRSSAFKIENNEYINLSINSSKSDIELAQNFPNPCSYTTNINMYVPQNIREANIYIYDCYGTQIQFYKILKRGDVSLTLDATMMNPGNYYYLLAADGKSTEIKELNLMPNIEQ